MKLACVLFSYFPYGGLQKDFANIVAACLKEKIAVSVFCMEWNGPEIPGLDIEIVPCNAWTKTGRRQQFSEHIKHLQSDSFDLVLGFNKLPGLDYYYAADTCFAEKAYNQRGFLYRLSPRTRQYLAFEKAVFEKGQQAKAMLLSPVQREQFIQHYQTEPERLLDLPPGISRSCMANEDSPVIRERMRTRLQVADDQCLVLQIGSAFATKGVDRSLHALAALPEALRARVRYKLVGQDNPQPYLKLIAKLNIGQCVEVLGPRDDIPDLLQAADVLLHPSYYESAGLVLLEAIVAGLPVLTTASCGYAFHVRQANAGLVCEEPFKQQELNLKLQTMLEGSSSEQWRNNGIAYGKQHNLYDMPAVVLEQLSGSR